MVKEISGTLNGSGLSVGIVVSKFNETVTKKLKNGAIRGLEKCDVNSDDIITYSVPGSFEIPGIARRVVQKRNHDGILCLGAVIRGETPHFEYICSEVSSKISSLSYESDIPVIFGVLTTNTLDQALNRAGAKHGNKGYQGALSLIETIGMYDSI